MRPLSEYIPSLRIDRSQAPYQIWCLIRKKWLLLTPEETIRQSAIQHCLHKGYPLGRISVEKKIKINTLSRRYDIVVYNKAGLPEILIECKAMGVAIGQSTLDQTTAYNHTLASTFIWITNGHDYRVFELLPDKKGLSIREDIPDYA